MTDLVSIIKNEESGIRTGFNMMNDDGEKEIRNPAYFRESVSEYSRIISAGGFFKYAKKER